MKYKHVMTNFGKQGQSLVEIVIALAIGAVIIGGASTAVVVVLQSGSTTQTQQTATVLAQDIVTNGRAFADTDWHNITALTQSSSTTYYFDTTSTSVFAIQGKEGVVEGDVSAGIVGHWQLDEATGTIAYDSSGDGNNGTLMNDPTRMSSSNCEAGGCLSFNGTNNYVSLGTPSSLSPNSITVTAWFKTTNATSTAKIVRNRLYGYTLMVTGNELAGDVWESSSADLSVTSASTINDGLWHFGALTYDGTTLTLYLDGKSVGSQTGSGTGVIYYSGKAVAIGRDADASNSYFDGSIDDVRIYSRALSADEIQHLYNSTAFTRYFYVEKVCRSNDTNYNIAGVAPCSGSEVNDPSTRKITAVIGWSARSGAQTFTIPFYVTRWRNKAFEQSDWSGGSGQTGPVTDTTNSYSSSTDVSVQQGSLKIQGL